MTDPHSLRRFVDAQRDVYASALAELGAGRKASHWMWFIFPQCAGLGTSAMSRLYAITSLEEARAYLTHPSLGPRLRECSEATNQHGGLRADQIFGPVDATKLRSSMTLFEAAAEEGPFGDTLALFFNGQRDARTLKWLRDHLH